MLLFVFFILVFPVPARAILGADISASGGWSETVNASDLTGGAGTNLNSTYTSASNATLISINVYLVDVGGWHVNVQRSDSNWNSNFHLYARRTGAGSGGTCTMSGGASYIELTTASQGFFQCSALLATDKNNIPIQYQLTGMSLNIPPGTYSTTIIFTVVAGLL